MDLQELFPESHFKPVNDSLIESAFAHIDQLTKPRGSLGELEKIAARLFAIGRGKLPIRINPVILYTVAADHGVACQNVSPCPQEVTHQMVENFLDGGAAISVLCRSNAIVSKLVDAGCNGAPFPRHSSLISRRLGNGTQDISQMPAMSREVVITGLREGFSLTREAARNGYACLGTGELGISNTTSATAIFCAFYNLDPEEIAGPGSGADPAMVAHKTAIIRQALTLHRATIETGEPIAILSALGGFEIVLLTGIMLGCASENLPLVVDGYICMAAYTASCQLYPPLAGYAFFSHISAEPGFQKVLSHIPAFQKPLLDLELRLGEGTGAALAIPILRSAAAIYNEMATFASAGITINSSK